MISCNGFGLCSPDGWFDKILEAAKKLEPISSGGFINIADLRNGSTFILSICGKIQKENIIKRRAEAQSAAKRLSDHPCDLSSWSSREPLRDRFGGAVRGNNFIFSFAGFSEAMNEAMMVLLLSATIQIVAKNAREILRISRNEQWGDLCIATGLRDFVDLGKPAPERVAV